MSQSRQRRKRAADAAMRRHAEWQVENFIRDWPRIRATIQEAVALMVERLPTFVEQTPRTFVVVNRRVRNPWQAEAWWRL